MSDAASAALLDRRARVLGVLTAMGKSGLHRLDPLMPENSEVGQKNRREAAGTIAGTVHMLEIDDGCEHLYLDADASTT